MLLIKNQLHYFSFLLNEKVQYRISDERESHFVVNHFDENEIPLNASI